MRAAVDARWPFGRDDLRGGLETGRPARGRPSWRASWEASPASTKRLVLVALALLVLAAVLAGAAANAAPRNVERTVRALSPAAVTVDAGGCPVTARCTVSAEVPASMLAALIRAFPSARVLVASSTLDVRTGRRYRSSVVALTVRGGTVNLLSQCVPGAAPVPEYQQSNEVSHVDLEGNRVVDGTTSTSVVGSGAGGCSAAVQLGATPSDAADLKAAGLLAHDRSVQLVP